VAVAALLLWLCTAAVGGYLLVTAAHSGNTVADPEEAVPVVAESKAASGGQAAGSPVLGYVNDRKLSRDDILFAPPSLQRARSESLPGLKDYAEFAHPALAMIGIGFWLGYVVSKERLFAMIGLGILLGAICAGVSLFTVNSRAAKRRAAERALEAEAEAASPPASADSDGADAGAAGAEVAPLTAPRLVLILHGSGAALTLLFALLIAFHA
jgi:hypothetical protein